MCSQIFTLEQSDLEIHYLEFQIKVVKSHINFIENCLKGPSSDKKLEELQSRLSFLNEELLVVLDFRKFYD
jgi:hypothetical protein